MTISFVNSSSAWAAPAASPLAPAIPASMVAGDIMVLWAHVKPFNATFTDPSGWTPLTTGSSSSTANGNGTGGVFSGCWFRLWQSGDAAPSIAVGSYNTGVAVIYGFRKTLANWVTPLDVGKGGNTTNNTAVSFTYTGLDSGDLTSGDLATYTVGVCDDATTHSAATLSATGATFGATTRVGTNGTNANGLDTSGWGGYASVTAGTSTATLAGSYTMSVAEVDKMSIAVRLRETNVALATSLPLPRRNRPRNLHQLRR